MSRLPIRVRLTLAFGAAMALVLAGVGYLVYARVGGALLNSVDQALRAQVHEAQQRERRSPLVDQDVAGGTTLAEIVARSGRVLKSTPPGLPRLLLARDAASAAAGRTVWRSVRLTTPPGHWRVLAVPAGGGGAIVLGRSLESRDATLTRLVRELLLAGAIGLVLACAIGYALAAAALRPVEAMRRRAAAMTVSPPTELPVPPSRDELHRLAVTLNEMLARIRDVFEHERRFVADASHELRTPLALLRTELELALRRPRTAVELELALRSAAEETERLSRLAENLLFIARVDQGALPINREPVPLDDVLAGVAERFASRAASIGRRAHVVNSGLAVDADPERLDQALSGLVDNALVHGQGAVTLTARDVGEYVEIHVTDEGAGFPEAFRERAFDRFSRADEARGRGGSGLGLSIVAAIVAAHGGSTGIENLPGRGADVWITLPRVDAPSHRRPVGVRQSMERVAPV